MAAAPRQFGRRRVKRDLEQAQRSRLQHRLDAGVHFKSLEGDREIAFDGSTGDAKDLANLPGEIAFAPKELRLARDLSERLGDTTVRSPSRSRPSGLSRGHRSVSESDQRRALLLPQELAQLPPDELIVLKAGLPPVRGRKVRYFAEAAFCRRVAPPPVVPTAPRPTATGPSDLPAPASPEPLTLDALVPMLASEGLEPLPPEGASAAAVEAWVERFLDASAPPTPKEVRHG